MLAEGEPGDLRQVVIEVPSRWSSRAEVGTATTPGWNGNKGDRRLDRKGSSVLSRLVATQFGKDTVKDIMEEVLPETKLEILSGRSVKGVLIFPVIVFIYALTLESVYFSVTHDLENADAAEMVYLFQGVTMTISLSLVFFAFLTFPQRIIRRYIKTKKVLPQQITLIIILFIMVFFPEGSIQGVIRYWDEFSAVKQTRDFSSFYYDLAAAGVVSNTSSMLGTTAVLFFWIWLLGIITNYTRALGEKLYYEQLQERLDAEEEELRKSSSGLSTVASQLEAGGLTEGEGIQSRYNRGEQMRQAILHPANFAQATQKKVKHKVNKIGYCSCFYMCCCCLCCSKERCESSSSNRSVIWKAVTCWDCSWLITYALSFSILSAAFDFEPSVIPLTGVITMLRVCSTRDPSGASYCSRDQYNQVGFQRAFCVAYLFLMECYIMFGLVGRASTKCFNTLTKVPVNLNRFSYLGFSYIQTLSLLIWIFILFIGLLEVSVPPVDVWIYNTTDQGPSPLFIVGVTSSGVGFAGCSFLINTWVFLMCFAYLPPDGYRGIRAWFYPKKAHFHGEENEEESKPEQQQQNLNNANKRQSRRMKRLSRRTTSNTTKTRHLEEEMDEKLLEAYFKVNPIILPSEQAFSELVLKGDDKEGNERQDSDLTENSSRKLMRQATRKSVRLFLEQDSTANGGGLLMHLQQTQDNSLRQQERLMKALVRSHVVVMDTCVMLFNFANVVYKLQKGNEDLEAEQAKIQDKRFTLVKHVVDEETDTHVIVCVSGDRIVVSFRGTVSGVNVKTDLDYALEPYPEADEIKPVKQPSKIHQQYAQQPSLVHKGFLQAYRSVRHTLHDLVTPLMYETVNGNIISQKRAILFTGHSLGGALAVMGSFDFACKIAKDLQVTDPALTCVTFASPRVGSYSFCQRFQRMVPTCRRFVLEGDVIPRTPPRLLTTGFLSGYHHVGTEILMDLKGNLLIGPNVAERLFLHRFRISKKNHFCSRYCLALVLFCGRMLLHDEPDFWAINLNSMITFAANDILKVDEDLFRHSLGFFLTEGVVYTANKKKWRTMGAQTQVADNENKTNVTLENQVSVGVEKSANTEEQEENEEENEDVDTITSEDDNEDVEFVPEEQDHVELDTNAINHFIEKLEHAKHDEKPVEEITQEEVNLLLTILKKQKSKFE